MLEEKDKIDDTELQEELKKMSFLARAWETTRLPLIVFIIVFLIFKFVIFHGYVPSSSMEDTIKTKSWILGDRISVALDKERENIKRYDIIIFESNQGSKNKEYMVKRVIGLPGEHMKITESDIYVNGQKLRKDFVYSEDVAQLPDEFDIPEGCFIVAGDNRNNSNDSRKWPDRFVKAEEIKAKVWYNYWFWHIGKMQTYEDNIKK